MLRALFTHSEASNTITVYDRYLLPTDDEAYEAMRRHKDREQQRKYELDSLHDSMYG